MTAAAASRPGLVVFSPLPPGSRSGIAAYTAELLPALARARRVTVVVASGRDVAPAEGAEAVVSEAEYRRSPTLQAQPHLLQLGNSLEHAHVYRAATRGPRPGVVVLHDPVLHHLVEALTLGRGDAAGYEAAMAANHGAAGRRLARLRRAGLFSPGQRYLLPLHAEVLDRARGVIVHSRFAAARLGGGGPPVRVVPHHLSPAVAAHDGLTREAARAGLGLPAEDVPVLLSLGHVTPAKGVEVALRALARLRRDGLDFLYVVAGQSDPAVDLPRLVREAGLEDRVRLTGWLPEAAFFAHARAADLLLNLRFPVAGETSGALVRALGMGLPALVYDFGPAAEYPDPILAKVAYRPGDPAQAVAQAIGALLANPAGLRARGHAARAWLRRHCTVENSAAAILDAIVAWG